ncbi:DNA cytosine methyltransferase [Oceanobacillus sojae]|uniref:DNA cytosine methyltransferase n=1 Tax=Oceanobacillus sojae TaxID=582851 RepID=UPI0009883660|nr:DNA cytosine methyltransferase [Oceanobacillus sojae]
MSSFTFIDLFAGIGGFRRGLEANGGTCVFSSEIDRFASQAYEAMYGDTPFGDITQIEAKDVPDHDVIASGFPCQSFSVAGKRGGFDDARGTLFFEVARIASQKQPNVLLLENVKGLVSHDKGKTLDTIVKTLNDIGYRVDFEILNSKYFGVPQNRERIFIVAVREDLVENEPWVIEGTTIIPKGKRRISGYEDVKTFNFDFPQNEEVTTRLRDVLQTTTDEKYYLNEEKTAKLVAQLEEQSPSESVGVGLRKQAQEVTRLTDESGTIMARDYKGFGNQEKTGVIETQMLGHVDIKGHDALKRVYSAEGVSPTLTTMSGGHREPKVAELQEIRPVLTPDRLTKRQNGRRFKETDEPSFTLTAQDRHGIAVREATKKGYAVACEGDAVNIQFPSSKTRRGRVGKQMAQTLEASGINQGVVQPSPSKNPPRYRIRKLTPLECFRLQGFPDSAHQKLVDAGISDSQRYKMAGNAVTVNVIEAIGAKLLPLLERKEEKEEIYV